MHVRARPAPLWTIISHSPAQRTVRVSLQHWTRGAVDAAARYARHGRSLWKLARGSRPHAAMISELYFSNNQYLCARQLARPCALIKMHLGRSRPIKQPIGAARLNGQPGCEINWISVARLVLFDQLARAPFYAKCAPRQLAARIRERSTIEYRGRN